MRYIILANVFYCVSSFQGATFQAQRMTSKKTRLHPRPRSTNQHQEPPLSARDRITVSLIDQGLEEQQKNELMDLLRNKGFRVVGLPAKDDAILYQWKPAVGMLQRVSSSHEAPRWIPVVQEQENVLIQNGWSFLDTDSSEKDAFDGDAADREGTYQPKWGHLDQSKEYSISSLGYSLRRWTLQDVLDSAKVLEERSRVVLLEGETDPPGRKLTANNFDFSGSLLEIPQGIFTCAVTGLPLFASSDLSISTVSSGWLSFSQPICPDHVQFVVPDENAVDRRTEVVCAQSGCHLGHYFGGDGYCINASVLNFIATGSCPSPGLQGPTSYRTFEKAASNPHWAMIQQIIREQVPTETIVLGAGCFWHVEFAIRRLPGIVDTKVGYAGGWTTYPSYEQVCEQDTGHAEVVEVQFDPVILEPGHLIDCFLAMHDPTKIRAHGKHSTEGQYRSCMFLPVDSKLVKIVYKALEDCRRQLQKDLTTEVRLMTRDTWFWEAEARHQRHDECQDCYRKELSTLSTEEWLKIYGKRRQRILGNANTLLIANDATPNTQNTDREEAIALTRLMI